MKRSKLIKKNARKNNINDIDTDSINTDTANMSKEIVYIIAEPGTGKTFNG